MDKKICYIILCLMLVSSVSAVSKSDFVQMVENTDYCFDCHTTYKVIKAADVPLVRGFARTLCGRA